MIWKIIFNLWLPFGGFERFLRVFAGRQMWERVYDAAIKHMLGETANVLEEYVERQKRQVGSISRFLLKHIQLLNISFRQLRQWVTVWDGEECGRLRKWGRRRKKNGNLCDSIKMWIVPMIELFCFRSSTYPHSLAQLLAGIGFSFHLIVCCCCSSLFTPKTSSEDKISSLSDLTSSIPHDIPNYCSLALSLVLRFWLIWTLKTSRGLEEFVWLDSLA